jgi:chromate reductase, NAD(P)H dehydrogenase (quinone)
VTDATPVRILMISGSLRGGSTNTALLRTAARLELDGVETELYDGMGGLPHFNPDDDPDGGTPPVAVAALRAELGRADALLLSTPEYAGALPGSFKNLLDWSVGGGETYAMPVAWVNTAGPAAPNGGRDAHDSLRKVLGYTGSELIEAACARIPVARDAISADGVVVDPELRGRIANVLRVLADAARARRDAD